MASSAEVVAEVYGEWAKAEETSPTDPYLALGVGRACTAEKIRLAALAQLKAYGASFAKEDAPRRRSLASAKSKAVREPALNLEDANIDGLTGAVKVLAMKVKQSAALLLNASTRKAFDEKRREKINSNQHARLEYLEGAYEGEIDSARVVEGQLPSRAGRGLTVMESGEMHDGFYENDAPYGFGMHTWKNGDLFVGQWKQGSIEGRGCYYCVAGGGYFGEFAAGLRSGSGIFVWPDRSTYKGQFQNGQRNGHGVLEVPKADNHEFKLLRYEGGWRNGDFEGDGIFEVLDDSLSRGVYLGQFQKSRFHGEGRIELPVSEAEAAALESARLGQKPGYVGSFVNGRPNGEGTLLWSDGDEYQGNVRNGLRAGFGIFRSLRQGLKLSGKWQEDELTGKATMTIDTSARALSDSTGPASAPALPGQRGIYVYSGGWKNGCMHNHGNLEFPDGSRYIGSFEDNLKHGQGTIFNSEGKSFDGIFQLDELVDDHQ